MDNKRDIGQNAVKIWRIVGI